MLTIPTRNDPIARFAVFALLALALWASFAQIQPKADAQGIIILDATPTPALPTPALAPALLLPTIDPPIAPALDSPILTSPDAAPAPAADPAEYLANVGAQAPHSPRGDVEHPPSFDSGPVLYPDSNIIIDPLPQVEMGIAVAVPAISAEQAAVIGARESHGCAAGETFYPRTGCHRMGSGGPLPGAVGEK